jgi:hypothetical protein
MNKFDDMFKADPSSDAPRNLWNWIYSHSSHALGQIHCSLKSFRRANRMLSSSAPILALARAESALATTRIKRPCLTRPSTKNTFSYILYLCDRAATLVTVSTSTATGRSRPASCRIRCPTVACSWSCCGCLGKTVRGTAPFSRFDAIVASRRVSARAPFYWHHQ